jgi:DNA-binding transcriptional LysR family regulator
MPERPEPLPPLQNLRAFEAAARLESFTAAAGELCLTQGAVSRQIRTLEERLRVSLFDRGDRGVRLTLAGRRYYDVVADALSALYAIE